MFSLLHKQYCGSVYHWKEISSTDNHQLSLLYSMSVSKSSPLPILIVFFSQLDLNFLTWFWFGFLSCWQRMGVLLILQHPSFWVTLFMAQDALSSRIAQDCTLHWYRSAGYCPLQWEILLDNGHSTVKHPGYHPLFSVWHFSFNLGFNPCFTEELLQGVSPEKVQRQQPLQKILHQKKNVFYFNGALNYLPWWNFRYNFFFYKPSGETLPNR